jgi:hypothetical protein
VDPDPPVHTGGDLCREENEEQTVTDGDPGPLYAPRRNKYFSGELLAAADFQREQTYSIDRGRLLSRLTVGTGVLSGLAVTAAADGTLTIEPGVALDHFGRVIIVPTAARGIDPAQPTDGNDSPAGNRMTGGEITVSLQYAEADGDPAPEGPRTTVETYRVVVRVGQPADQDTTETLVVLATVTLPQQNQPLSIDDRCGRVEIVSNSMLLAMIDNLADRVAVLSAKLGID